MAIPLLIREIRTTYNLSQKDLAWVLGTSAQNISRWEKAQSTVPTAQLCLLSYYFKLPLEQVLDYEHHVAPHRYRKEVLEDLELRRTRALPFSNGLYQAQLLTEFSKPSWLEESHHSFEGMSLNQLKQDCNLLHYPVLSNEMQPRFKSGDQLFFCRSHHLQNGIALLDFKEGRQIYRLEKHTHRLLLHPIGAEHNGKNTVHLQGRSLYDVKVLGYLSYAVRHFPAQKR